MLSLLFFVFFFLNTSFVKFVQNGASAYNFTSNMQLHTNKTPRNSFAGILKEKNADNVCNLSGLKWMKDVILGKRNDHTFPSVVVGDPHLELTEIGVPCEIAKILLVSEHVNRHNMEKLLHCSELQLLQKGHVRVLREGSLVPLHKREELQPGDTFYRPLADGDMVLINRSPSIHQHSLIALYVRVLPLTSYAAHHFVGTLMVIVFMGIFHNQLMQG